MAEETLTPETSANEAPQAVTDLSHDSHDDAQPAAAAEMPVAAADEPSTLTGGAAMIANLEADVAVLQGENAPTPTIGRIVHVALDRGVNTGDCRPAIIVRVWNDEMINVQLFTDGFNDHQDLAGGIAWLTSLHYIKPVPGLQTPPNTWHWPNED